MNFVIQSISYKAGTRILMGTSESILVSASTTRNLINVKVDFNAVEVVAVICKLV